MRTRVTDGLSTTAQPIHHHFRVTHVIDLTLTPLIVTDNTVESEKLSRSK